MLTEKRIIEAREFGNEEDAIKAILETIPNSTIASAKRIAQAGFDPLFVFEVHVRLYPSRPDTKKGAKSENDIPD